MGFETARVLAEPDTAAGSKPLWKLFPIVVGNDRDPPLSTGGLTGIPPIRGRASAAGLQSGHEVSSPARRSVGFGRRRFR